MAGWPACGGSPSMGPAMMTTRIRSCRAGAWVAARRRPWIAPAAYIWPTRGCGGSVFPCSSGGGGLRGESDRFMFGYALQEVLEVVAGEGPVEGVGNGVVAVLEGGQPSGDGGRIEKVVGVDHFSLYYREVDLHLVEPRGVNGQVDELEGGPFSFEAVDSGLPPMGAAVVHYPEHPLGAGVGLGCHHLFRQPPRGDDPGRVLATAEHLGPMHVVGGQVGHRSFALVLVLDTHEP